VPRGALGRDSLARLLNGDPPLVADLRDREAQLQPNGIDLTFDHIWRLDSTGILGGPHPGRQLPERTEVAPDLEDWYELSPGPYVVRLHEWINVPTNLLGLAFPRSTLLRCGAQLFTAVWDAGYGGQGEVMVLVGNPYGLRLKVGVAICQIVFFTLTESVSGYSGVYQQGAVPPAG
jgi:dUTP pyrophosphatase